MRTDLCAAILTSLTFFFSEDGDLLKVVLTRLTKHATFPNIILRGHSLGGADELQALHDAGKLEELFEENGLAVHGSR